MSDKKIKKDDKMVDNQLNMISNTLGISIGKLIDRYVARGLYTDDYYVPPTYTRDEMIERGKKAVERDLERGIPLRKHDFNKFINRWSFDD